MTKIALIAAAIIAATAGTASAHSIDAHRAELKIAIEEGRRSGEITFREGRRLRAELDRIARLELKLLEDGYLSKRDSRILHDELNAAEAKIAHESDDRWRRARFLPRIGK